MPDGKPVPPPGGGEKRFGRYLLLERIGRGGMAEVYRAVANGPGGFQRRFVIKRIRKEKAGSRDFVDMFVNEARISALLDHPNIVQVYEFGQVDGDYFLAMEHLRGRDLLAVMGRVRSNQLQLPIEVACFVASEVARGLAYAHSLTSEGEPLGIVHRDVTPSNIMLLSAGGVKLLDFGIARAEMRLRSTTPTTGLLKGKPSYLSPEQVRGEAVLPQADIWSVGVLLWEILTGRRLFQHVNDLETMRNVLHQEVAAPSSLRSAIHPDLDRVVLRALDRDPRRRFGSAAEFAEAIRALPIDLSGAPQAISSLLREQFGTGSFDLGPLRYEEQVVLCSEPAAAADVNTPSLATVPNLRANEIFAMDEEYSFESSSVEIPAIKPRRGRLRGRVVSLSALAVAAVLVAGVGFTALWSTERGWRADVSQVVSAFRTAVSEPAPTVTSASAGAILDANINDVVAEAMRAEVTLPARLEVGAVPVQIAASFEPASRPSRRSGTSAGRSNRSHPPTASPSAGVADGALEEARARGLAAFAEGRFEAARVTLLAVAQTGGSDARVSGALADIEFELGNFSQAHVHAARAAALAPRSARYRNAIGDACFKLGQPDCAAAAYQQALDRDPDNRTAREGLRRLGR